MWNPALLSALLPIPLAFAIQPSAPSAVPATLRSLEWGKLNFLQTTDTHGWLAGHLQEPQYSADWGDYLSFTTNMHKLADNKGVDLLIVDTGDRIEGNGLSDASSPKGKYVREIFSAVDMDVVTIGNHELYKPESAMNEYLHIRPHYGEKYVVSNVDIYAPDPNELVPLGHRFRKFTTKNQGIRVTAFGFLYDFTRNNYNTVVHPVEKAIEEPWFVDAIRDPDVDIFVIIGHTPVREFPEFPAILAAIRKFHPNTLVQFLGGHSHIRDFTLYDELSTGVQGGRYCETVAWLSISRIPPKHTNVDEDPVVYSRAYIDFNRYGFQHHANQSHGEFDTEVGLELSKEISRYRSRMDLDHVIGCAPQDYYVYRVPYPNPNSIYSLLADRVLPEMVKNPDREGVPTLIFVNSGSLRFDIFKGRFTTDTSYIISPFTSRFRYLPNVPYSAARRLIYIANRPGETWMSAADGVPESNYYFAKLDSATPQNYKGQPQQVLGQSLYAAKSPDYESHPHQIPLTPGYNTCDDFGNDGDDTLHVPIITNIIPNAIVANRSFSNPEPDVVDVVFFDFFMEVILEKLKLLGRKYRLEDVKQYMRGDPAMTELIQEWVRREWKGDC